jgi:riboflavin kinase/FMN adenylyltransferase
VHWLRNPLPDQSSIVAIGQFDGVHRGHRALIRSALDRSDEERHRVGVVTFDRHPLSLLAPHREPAPLTLLEDKIRHLLGCGLDFVAELTLSDALLAHEPDRFVDEVLLGGLASSTVVVGPNFRFGRGATGDTDHLVELGKTRGLDVRVPRLTRSDGDVVSSTRVRAAVAAGRLVEATGLLARPHAVRGVVTRRSGRQLVVSVAGRAALPSAGTFAGRLTSGSTSHRWTSVRLTVVGRQLLMVLAATGGVPAPGEKVLVDLTG